MEFHDDYPSYETMYNHDEAYGKKARRTLWNVFWIMLAITIGELIVGFLAPGKGWTGSIWLKIFFISFTIIKAGYIVMAFMHLGHEVKFFKYMVLMPYILFMFYIMFIVLTEGTYSGQKANVTRVDPIYIQQQLDLQKGHGHSGGHEAAAGHEEAPKEEAHH